MSQLVIGLIIGFVLGWHLLRQPKWVQVVLDWYHGVEKKFDDIVTTKR